MSRSIRAVAFDLFGTLICPGGRANIFRELPQISGAERKRLREALLRGQENLAELPGWRRATDGATLYADALPAIVEARRRGLQVACISNLARPMIAAVDRLLPDAFDVSIFSCEVGHIKPEPEIYRALVDGLGLKPQEIIIVGDSMTKDCLVPRELGFRAIWLDRTGAEGDGIRSLAEVRF